MTLLDELAGAQLTVVDTENRIVYAWFGGSGVNIYDESGVEVDYFTMESGTKLTPVKVRAAMERVMASRDDE
jgi:hypothetical protein